MKKRKPKKRKFKQKPKTGLLTIQHLLGGIVGDLASAASARNTNFLNISTDLNRMESTLRRIEELAVRIDESQTQVLQQTLPSKETRVRLVEDGDPN